MDFVLDRRGHRFEMLPIAADQFEIELRGHGLPGAAETNGAGGAGFGIWPARRVHFGLEAAWEVGFATANERITPFACISASNAADTPGPVTTDPDPKLS